MKKIIKSISLGIAMMLFAGVSAQTTIEGFVSYQDSVTVVTGISVYLEGTNHGTITSGSGRFTLPDVPDGTYRLIAAGMGYLSNIETLVVQGQPVITKKIVMRENINALDEFVVMTRGRSGIREIPGSVYYLSPEDLLKNNYTDVNRALRNVPGVNIQEEDGYGLRTNIGLRGTGVERSSKISIMEDGVPIAPAPYAAPAAYYFPTFGRIQAVEVLKGSSQIKYGPHTSGGAINLISTQIPDVLSARINLSAGSYGARNLHAVAGNAHEQVAYVVETFQYGADGFKQLDDGTPIGFDKKDYMAKLRLNTKQDAKVYQSFQIKVAEASELSDETYLGLTEQDFDSSPFRVYQGAQMDQMTTLHRKYMATHFARFSDHLCLTTTAYQTEFSRNWYKLDAIKDSLGNKYKIDKVLDAPDEVNDAFYVLKGANSVNEEALFVKANNRSYLVQGLQTQLGVHFRTDRVVHELDAGIRLHRDEMDRFQWEDAYAMREGVMGLTKAGEPGTESNRIESAASIASFLKYKVKWGRFTLIPGVRHEYIVLNRLDYGKNDPQRTGIDLNEQANEINMLIPGVGFDYQWNDYTHTFAGVHKGFSPPGAQEGALPEESVNYEAGLRYTKGAANFQSVFFYNDYNNLLGSDLAAAGGNGSGDLHNAGEVTVKGLELQAGYDILSPWQFAWYMPLMISYTYSDAVFNNTFASSFKEWGDVEAGDFFPYMSKHQLSLQLGIEHKRVQLHMSSRYAGEMRTRPGQGPIPEGTAIPAHFLLDASMHYHVSRQMSLFATATNLSNETYLVSRRPSGLRPGMPRTFSVGIKAFL